jgi:archaellum component FlaF (FlaF/FlaG flagellin family)
MVVSGNELQNSSVETGSATTPDCWLLGGYGSNGYSWARTNASAHSGLYGEQLNVTSFSNGDRKLLSAFNNTCSPSITQGHAYTVTVWYKSSAHPAIFAFTRNASTGRYGWWTQSPRLPSASSWTAATWTTPAVPAGVTNLSVGLGLQMAGSVTIDDLALTDTAGGGGGSTPPPPDTTPPSVSLTAPTAGATIAGPMTMSANAADNVAVDHVDLLIDGTTMGTIKSAPYQISYDSTSLTNGAHTVSARAVDSSGNARATTPISVTINNPPPPTPDTTAPSVTLSAPSAGSTLSGMVTLTATASDNVAVATVGFLIDGAQIGSTTSSPYKLSLDSTSLTNGAHTISARAVDSSGNAKTSAAVAVTVNNAPPPPLPLPPPLPTGGTFTTLASGVAGLPRTACASQVTTSTWEPISSNATANHSVPAGPVPWSNAELGPYWAKWIAKRNLVTGNYTGTTNQIIQWSACKWGMDEDLMRAVAVQESDWRESMVGDNCGRTGQASYGLFQIKNAYCSGADAWGGYPYSATYTALNADFYGAYLRSCLDGDFYASGNSWLYNGQSMPQIIAANGLDYAVWGCVGSWFSGGWYDSGAQNYINGVKGHLANKDWLKY